MENVKVFYENAHSTHSATKLEEKMNDWLNDMSESIEITRIMQTSTGRMDNHVTITIFYKTK